eukprot:g15579.t1
METAASPATDHGHLRDGIDGAGGDGGDDVCLVTADGGNDDHCRVEVNIGLSVVVDAASTGGSAVTPSQHTGAGDVGGATVMNSTTTGSGDSDTVLTGSGAAPFLEHDGEVTLSGRTINQGPGEASAVEVTMAAGRGQVVSHPDSIDHGRDVTANEGAVTTINGVGAASTGGSVATPLRETGAGDVSGATELKSATSGSGDSCTALTGGGADSSDVGGETSLTMRTVEQGTDEGGAVEVPMAASRQQVVGCAGSIDAGGDVTPTEGAMTIINGVDAASTGGSAVTPSRDTGAGDVGGATELKSAAIGSGDSYTVLTGSDADSSDVGGEMSLTVGTVEKPVITGFVLLLELLTFGAVQKWTTGIVLLLFPLLELLPLLLPLLFSAWVWAWFRRPSSFTPNERLARLDVAEADYQCSGGAGVLEGQQQQQGQQQGQQQEQNKQQEQQQQQQQEQEQEQEQGQQQGQQQQQGQEQQQQQEQQQEQQQQQQQQHGQEQEQQQQQEQEQQQEQQQQQQQQQEQEQQQGQQQRQVGAANPREREQGKERQREHGQVNGLRQRVQPPDHGRHPAAAAPAAATPKGARQQTRQQRRRQRGSGGRGNNG